MPAISAAFLLAGCSSTNVVTTPLALRPVPQALLENHPAKQCLPRKDEYSVRDLEDGYVCERTEKEMVRSQLKALQGAVRSREAIAKRAVAASLK